MASLATTLISSVLFLCGVVFVVSLSLQQSHVNHLRSSLLELQQRIESQADVIARAGDFQTTLREFDRRSARCEEQQTYLDELLISQSLALSSCGECNCTGVPEPPVEVIAPDCGIANLPIADGTAQEALLRDAFTSADAVHRVCVVMRIEESDLVDGSLMATLYSLLSFDGARRKGLSASLIPVVNSRIGGSSDKHLTTALNSIRTSLPGVSVLPLSSLHLHDADPNSLRLSRLLPLFSASCDSLLISHSSALYLPRFIPRAVFELTRADSENAADLVAVNYLDTPSEPHSPLDSRAGYDIAKYGRLQERFVSIPNDLSSSARSIESEETVADLGGVIFSESLLRFDDGVDEPPLFPTSLSTDQRLLQWLLSLSERPKTVPECLFVRQNER